MAPLQRRGRPLLVCGAGLSAIWAGYWLWPRPVEPDFLFDAHPTSIIVFNDMTKDMRPELPYYEKGRFHSPAGAPIRPQDVIRDERSPHNIDSLSFLALFRLGNATTQADFVEASEKIWALCDAGIAVATDDREDAPTLFPVRKGRDCDYLFAPERQTDSLPR